MAKFTGSLVTYPARATFIWFAALILTGASVLALPLSHADPLQPVSFLDALFTSTSAACVTGLAVVSTPDRFSRFGQATILALIQLGGIGIITVTTFLTLRFGGRESLRQRAVIAATLGSSEYDLRWVLRNVLMFVLGFEGIGFAVLALRNLVEGDGPVGASLWEAFFHSVSAFCNAGFSLHNDSLCRYRGDVIVNLTIGALIVLGGLGFPVILDIRRHWGRSWADRWNAITLHSKMMLIGTVGLLGLGALAILALEWNHSLRELPLGEKLLAAGFQSVVPRTAGFQSIDLRHCTDATLFVIVLLMLIGAGPCSTAGGFKVSTFMVLLTNARAKLTGHLRVSLFRRSIPAEAIERAVATALIFAVVAAVALMGLLIVEPATRHRFLPSVVEVASALGTVGLSVDPGTPDGPATEPDPENPSVSALTPSLSPAGKIIIIGLMFLGRLGPISVFLALSLSERKDRLEFPNEEILIG